MNRELFDKQDGTKSRSGTYRYENMYSGEYKPQKKRIVLSITDPILHSRSQSKKQKYFGDPDKFRGSVKKTALSMRSSNIFSESQTEVTWKSTVKKVVDCRSSQVPQVQKNHIILTDYTQRYKRNPLTQSSQIWKSAQVQRKVSRNPIVQGQSRTLLQTKGRRYRPDL